MTSSPSTSLEQKPPAFLREELFELVDEWCQQLFGTEDKPEAAAYELARLAAEHAAIEALYAIRIRMGDHTYRYHVAAALRSHQLRSRFLPLTRTP